MGRYDRKPRLVLVRINDHRAHHLMYDGYDVHDYQMLPWAIIAGALGVTGFLFGVGMAAHAVYLSILSLVS